jgi:precorrin-6B methylase 2
VIGPVTERFYAACEDARFKEVRGMNIVATHFARRAVVLLLVAVTVPLAAAQQTNPSFVPEVGQYGRDVVWVPTSPELLAKMLDMANVTPQDFVIDLGSGDGRIVIGAARRGARALGVEYNPDMVELSKRNAAEAGVLDRATFVQGDMFEADISKASVMALFLTTSNMTRLRPKFLDLAPGTRIVSNTFGIEGWMPDQVEIIPGLNCNETFCTVLMWIVPAKVQGTWRLPQGDLILKQEYQMLSGTLGSAAISEGKLLGTEITFKVGTALYTGRVSGNRMEGTVGSERWTALRTTP